MSRITNCLAKLQNKPRLRQWLWFVGLWLAGLIAVTVLTYPIKLLIKLLKS